MISKKTALSLAIGSAFAASFAVAPVASAADNPFKMDSLKNGYQVAAADDVKESKRNNVRVAKDKSAKKSKEGKCGEGKCGSGK